MLSVKDAVQSAQNWVKELYPSTDLKDFRLEEVEASEDGRYWLITVGWAEPAYYRNLNSLAAALAERQPQTYPRIYKTLEVDAESGAVRSMKIREVA